MPKLNLRLKANYILNFYLYLIDLKINDQPVTRSSNFYNYKCYIQSLCSFDDQAKSSNLFLSGWLTDEPETVDGIGGIEPSSTNESQLSRNAWFRKNIFKPKVKGDYSEDGFTFLAPLKAGSYNDVYVTFSSCYASLIIRPF